MSQEEINRTEWENPDNWGGPDWMAVYFSKKDTRTWVPKRIPAMGWTLNLGRDRGVRWLIAFVGAGAAVGIAALTVAVAVIFFAK